MPVMHFIVHNDVVERAIAELVQEGKEDYFLQRIYTSTFVISDGHESAHMANGSGVLPGDHAATKLFVKTYGYGVESMINTLNEDPWQRALHMTMPEAVQSQHGTSTVDLATSSLVDDVARQSMGAYQDPIQRVASWENSVFDDGLEEIGGAQNRYKPVKLVQGAGPP